MSMINIPARVQRELAMPKKNMRYEENIRWHIGAFAEMLLVDKLAMRVEANYEYLLNGYIHYYYHQKLSYLNEQHALVAPVMLSYKPHRILNLDAGVEAIWVISPSDRDDMDLINKYNVAIAVGIGLNFGDHFRWNMGMSYLLLPLATATLYDQTIYHRLLKGNFSVAYLFRPWK